MYQEIKKGIIEILKKIKEIDVLTEINEDVETTGAYFFLEIIPVIKETCTINLYKEKWFIDISYHDNDFSISEFMKVGEKIDENIRPSIGFESFSATPENVNMRAVDGVLHYTFGFSLMYEIKHIKDEPLMEHLDIRKESI